jgi:hypothetical protein
MVLTSNSNNKEVAEFYLEMLKEAERYPEECFVTGVVIADSGGNGYDGGVIEIATREFDERGYVYSLYAMPNLLWLLNAVDELRPCSTIP